MTLQKHRKNLIQEDLERRILHGLVCEWEIALWVLNRKYKGSIKKPLIGLSDMKSRLGYWSGEKQEIRLSRTLVLNHPWDAVREVLLHEMAHQFAEQVLGLSGNESSHGPKFQEACRILRANPKASGKYKSLDEQLYYEVSNSEDRMLRRVRKLMALAKSRNRHEAEAAMAKAHELISKYNVNLLVHDNNRHYISVFIGKPALRHPREVYHLAHLLLDYYFVDGIWVPAYVLDKCKMGRVLEITGTAQNVKIAGYIHDFVMNFISSQWNSYNKERKFNRYRKTDFAVGIIEGFRTKLESHKSQKKAPGDKSALTIIEDPMLKEYITYKYPHTTSFSRKASGQDADILNDGIQIGRKLIISKGITEEGNNQKLFIEDKT